MTKKVKIVPKSIEWTSLLVSLLLEGFSAILDQLGFSLPSMIIAFMGLLLAITDLTLKAQEKRLIWVVGSSFLPRNFSSNGKRFDSLVAYFGVACAAWQCLFSTIGYLYAHQNLNNPIKMCLLPFVFVSCVVITQFIKNTVPSAKKSQATEARTAEEADETEDDLGGGVLYTKLWHACAGPLVTVPHAGDLVYYFPQGHIEQIEALSQQIPTYDLPMKILCRVINVQLRTEPDTDEVFAQATLLPDLDDHLDEEEDRLPKPPSPQVQSFCKILTDSDISTLGGSSVLEQLLDECLPPLGMSSQPPALELVAEDLSGNEWRFHHIFQEQPWRHLLQSGWSLFVSAKKLVAGDAFIFLRGETGELRVGVKRAMKQLNIPSIVSSFSMHLGILATACHAITTGTLFTVYYRPRTSPADFIIPAAKYIESVKKNHTIGMRFEMRFEGKETSEQSFSGTVIGVEDADPKMWPDSKWRCLKVSWDEPSPFPRPDRISPWNVEPESAPSLDPLDC